MKLRILLRIAIPLAVVLTLTGCNIIPKKVEYFQNRVQPMPERTPLSDESLRQAHASPPTAQPPRNAPPS